MLAGFITDPSPGAECLTLRSAWAWVWAWAWPTPALGTAPEQECLKDGGGGGGGGGAISLWAKGGHDVSFFVRVVYC